MIELLARELDSTDTDLEVELLASRRVLPQGFYDLRSLDVQRFRYFLHAVEATYEHMIPAEATLFTDEGYYVNFMFHASHLKALLRTDPRADKQLSEPGTIVIQANVLWSAPGWIFDVVLEHLAAEVRQQNNALATSLLLARAAAPVARRAPGLRVVPT